jgi:hypothetical protein
VSFTLRAEITPSRSGGRTVSFLSQSTEELFHLGRRLRRNLPLPTRQVLQLVVLHIRKGLDHEFRSGAKGKGRRGDWSVHVGKVVHRTPVHLRFESCPEVLVWTILTISLRAVGSSALNCCPEPEKKNEVKPVPKRQSPRRLTSQDPQNPFHSKLPLES